MPKAKIATLDGSVEATLTWTGDRMPYRFVRVVSASPGEIAISIGAELIAIRHGKDVSALSMKWKRPTPKS